MKTSEVIKTLEKLIQDHGDLDVCYADDRFGDCKVVAIKLEQNGTQDIVLLS